MKQTLFILLFIASVFVVSGYFHDFRYKADVGDDPLVGDSTGFIQLKADRQSVLLYLVVTVESPIPIEVTTTLTVGANKDVFYTLKGKDTAGEYVTITGAELNGTMDDFVTALINEEVFFTFSVPSTGNSIDIPAILDDRFYIAELMANQEPAVDSKEPVITQGWIVLAKDERSALVTLNSDGLKGVTGLHIHKGALGAEGLRYFDFAVDGPEVVDFLITQENVYNENSTFADFVSDLKIGETYFNIHTEEYTGGAIRGQIYLQDPPSNAKLSINWNLDTDSVCHEVTPGTFITWIFDDPFTHTVTSTDSDYKVLDVNETAAILRSGELESTNFYYSITAPGVYYYICELHETMRGRLIVGTSQTCSGSGGDGVSSGHSSVGGDSNSDGGDGNTDGTDGGDGNADGGSSAAELHNFLSLFY